MNRIAEAAYQELARGETIVLAGITSQQGSTPRTAGTRMMIARGGKQVGTIGGGLLEGEVIEQSVKLLDGGPARLERFDLRHTDMAAMDMICGGNLEVLLDPFPPTAQNVALFDRWRQMAAQGEAGAFVTAIRRGDGPIDQVHHALVQDDGTVLGDLPLTPGDIETLIRSGLETRTMQKMVVEAHSVILEPILKSRTLFILGAGHVAQPTAHMAALAGFRVVVLDDRDAFANTARFPDAHTVCVLPDLECPFSDFVVDRDCFIVIVTRGHLYDKAVLARSLCTEARYIGMIGSRRKRDAIFRDLKSEGFDEKALQRVHSPIGLNIGAETPEEIAVSIVAEIINVAAERSVVKL